MIHIVPPVVIVLKQVLEEEMTDEVAYDTRTFRTIWVSVSGNRPRRFHGARAPRFRVAIRHWRHGPWPG
jgi:hypothetical protein